MQYQVVWRWIISLGTMDGHRPGSLGSIALNWERFTHWPWITSFLAPLPSQAHKGFLLPGLCLHPAVMRSSWLPVSFAQARMEVGTTSITISTIEHVAMCFVPRLSSPRTSIAQVPPIPASCSADLRGSSSWTLSTSPPPQPGTPPLPRGPT